MRFRSSTVIGFIGIALCVTHGGCKRVAEPPAGERPRPATASAANTDNAASLPSVAPSATTPLIVPTELLSLPSSAYQASLFADEAAIELLTSTAAHRLLPDQQPLTRAIDLGFAATVTRKNYVYWSRGAIWSQPRRAKDPQGATKLAALAEEPQRIVADIGADEFALLMHAEGDRYAIAKFENRRLSSLYTSHGSIDALTMIGDTLYFVERPGGASWRIGSVKFSGGSATFGADKSGRWPALLRGSEDLVYYDGSRRDVLRLDPDLQHEHTLAKDFICSPMAVTTNVYCSTMEGIFELSATGQRRQLVAAPRQLITNLAANSERLAFITDSGGQGQDRLTLYVVPLGKPSDTAH